MRYFWIAVGLLGWVLAVAGWNAYLSKKARCEEKQATPALSHVRGGESPPSSTPPPAPSRRRFAYPSGRTWAMGHPWYEIIDKEGSTWTFRWHLLAKNIDDATATICFLDGAQYIVEEVTRHVSTREIHDYSGIVHIPIERAKQVTLIKGYFQ